MSDEKKTTAAPNANGKPEPIRVARLLLQHTNPHGVRLPFPGRDGGPESQLHSIEACDKPDVKVEIEFRPWMRHHRVVRTELDIKTKQPKVTHSFFVHETWCSWVPLAE